MSTFAELGVSEPVVAALAKRNINEPFKIQNLVLADALAGRDILAKSRTGSGKTLGFGIPIVERLDGSGKQPTALILVPTRELAVQVTEEIRTIAAARRLRVAAVFGGVSIEAQAKKAANAHVLVATPGRMMDVVNRRLVSLDNIKILVLDEADRMLDMGFQPQVDRIVDKLRGRRQTMFFSATLDGTVGHLAKAYTHEPVRHEVADERSTIEEADHRFVKVSEHDRLGKLIEILEEERGLALVFVRTKRGCDRLEMKLKAKGIEARALHGDMTQAARQRALDRFAAGKVDVLVATDVAARGLDLDDITHVVNYDPPRDHKDYVHRVGRTARAGRGGAGVTFVSPAQLGEVSAVARQLDLKDEFAAGGLQMTAPATVFSSKGKRSSMRSRTKRKF
ncbi:MAG: ATP-dependent helicase RhlE [Actinomycetota bacterium]|jgi:superfamily II DNA/RNA helicase|nr:ATP-dependent helicase RhlE [Actinomycetota bacterium]